MEQIYLTVNPRLLPDMATPRVGIHVTSLIAEIEATLGVKREPLPHPIPSTYALVGIAWEAYVRSEIGEEYVWDIPVEMDGIIGTLDALDVSAMAVVECKATWMSSNKEPRDIWRWTCQIKAYCHMIGVREARMYILYVCGNWKPPTPLIREVVLIFTERELEENWTMLRSHKESKYGTTD